MHQLCRDFVLAKRIAAGLIQIGQPLVLKQQKQESLTCFIRFYLTVKDILVNGEPLDPERIYTVSGNRYALLGHGDGHTAFDGANELPHDYVEDSTALRNFLVEELGGVVPDEYSERYGTDRIMLLPQSHPRPLSHCS